MEASRKKVVELNIEDVLPNRFQPRIKFNEDAIVELSKSIKEHGVIQPIVVRPIGDKFEIIAGERRYKASCMAELKTIPAIITDLNDKDSAEVALIENVQRENLTPIEEAISYKKILDMGYITQDALALKLGKTQSTVANKLRLLNLDDEVQEALLNEKISERHARSLLKLSNKNQQKQMLEKIITERLTVRKADEEIDKILNGEDIKIETKNQIQTNNLENNEEENVVEENMIEEEPKNKFINILPETEINDIEEKTETINESSEPEELNEEIKPGKFFNILNSEEKTGQKAEQKEEVYDFNKMFFNPTGPEEPKNDNNALIQEIEEIENSINNSNTIPPIFETATEENTTKNIEKESNKIENKEDEEDLEFIYEDDFEDESENEELPKQEEITEEPKEQTYQQEKNKINEIKINNFKDVLQLIRNCSDQIEESGYIIDTEEVDLENEYQVIFKIVKK